MNRDEIATYSVSERLRDERLLTMETNHRQTVQGAK